MWGFWLPNINIKKFNQIIYLTHDTHTPGVTPFEAPMAGVNISEFKSLWSLEHSVQDGFFLDIVLCIVGVQTIKDTSS